MVDEFRQTEIEGIYACGNVLQVHDLVDYVSEEAELAGKGAAEYIKNGANNTPTVAVGTGKGVRYCLPQRIHTNGQENIALFMRVDKPYGKVTIKAESGGKIIAKSVRIKAAPGEMEKLVIKKDLLGDIKEDITVYLEEM